MQILVKDILVNYEQIGEGSEDLLILHGWGSSLSAWKAVSIFCSQKYRVTLLDFPGFGGSEEPNEVWDTYAYTEFVQEFLTKLNISHTIVMGHSFGGRVTTILATKYPRLVSQIILVDPGGIEIKSFKIKCQIFLYKLFWKPLGKLFGEKIKKLFGSTDYKTVSGIMRKTFVRVVNQDLRYLFPVIKQPITIIWGSNDQMLSVNYTKIYKKFIPHAQIKIVWGAGHNPHLSHQSDFFALLGDTLKL